MPRATLRDIAEGAPPDPSTERLWASLADGMAGAPRLPARFEPVLSGLLLRKHLIPNAVGRRAGFGGFYSFGQSMHRAADLEAHLRLLGLREVAALAGDVRQLFPFDDADLVSRIRVRLAGEEDPIWPEIQAITERVDVAAMDRPLWSALQGAVHAEPTAAASIRVKRPGRGFLAGLLGRR